MSTGIRNTYFGQAVTGATTPAAVPGFPASITLPKNSKAFIRITAKATTGLTGLIFDFTPTTGSTVSAVNTEIYDGTTKGLANASTSGGDGAAILTNAPVQITCAVSTTAGAVLPILLGAAPGGTLDLAAGAVCEVTIF